ncbi:chromate efflux transporter [Chroococcus sp. FPU101]|uniref:chromate efflux transporter n=1 Tax=Chroococcus sp. FPU101 TaxID=1974212 RepID=UPI001A8D3FF2|nr:chromate efflux transporter [Chroococcus sp. FPU101]GFE70801.1 chromate transporter, chromate ion transporter (CHR) family [Chroococcus sp. FPU101]
MSTNIRPSLSKVALLFLKIGVIGFGGPAAHIALMEDEVVNRRRWMSREDFLDVVGATNLIPGPNSTEMAIHIGYILSGLPGLILAGSCFIIPAVITTAFLAWVYQSFGTLPEFYSLFYGIKAVVLAVIFNALWKLGQKAIKNRQLLMIALGVIALQLVGVNEIAALLIGGLVGMLILTLLNKSISAMILGGFGVSLVAQNSVTTSPVVTPSLWQLGLFFLKVGSVLFGSGYVLIAFIEGELVNQYHWLTQQQLLDAVAIGQFTPGPVSSTATFIGYLILGIPGAIVATIAIFLPSFFFVLALNPFIPKMRQSKWASAFLDAVNASAVALMVFVLLKLVQQTLLQPFDIWATLMAIVAVVLLLRFKINTTWLIIGGAIVGWLLQTVI